MDSCDCLTVVCSFRTSADTEAEDHSITLYTNPKKNIAFVDLTPPNILFKDVKSTEDVKTLCGTLSHQPGPSGRGVRLEYRCRSAAVLAPIVNDPRGWLTALSGGVLRAVPADQVGRCRLTVSKPKLIAPVVSALETMIS